MCRGAAAPRPEKYQKRSKKKWFETNKIVCSVPFHLFKLTSSVELDLDPEHDNRVLDVVALISCRLHRVALVDLLQRSLSRQHAMRAAHIDVGAPLKVALLTQLGALFTYKLLIVIILNKFY